MSFKSTFKLAVFLSVFSWGVQANAQGSSDEISISAEAQTLFDLAAELYPGLFSNGTELRSDFGYIYRYFSISGVYAGIKDGDVYLLGGPFGGDINTIVSRGSISASVSQLQQAKADLDIEIPDIEIPDVELPTGLYDLTVTGEISITGLPVAVPPTVVSLTLEDTVAPNVNDQAEIEDTVLETLTGVSGISNIVIVTDVNTEDQVKFRISFNATQSGATVSMELTYDYVKN